MSDPRILIGENPDEATRLATECFRQALADGGQKSAALSGGSTPRRLYQALAAPPWRAGIDWTAIDWFWSDERCVPPTHPDSNYRLAWETLLEPLCIAGERIHRIPGDAMDPDSAAAAYEREIRRHVPATHDGVPVLDLVLLGVGADGHTASLFPGAATSREQMRLAAATDGPVLGYCRITMTWPLILAARQVIVFVTGAEKAEILARTLGPQPDPALPASRLRSPGAHVTWVVDAAAARLVNTPSRP